jgi:hypothetical protein
LLHAAGFPTYVMMEPYLSDPASMIAEALPFVSEVIAIGQLNYGKSFAIAPEIERGLQELYKFENVLKLAKLADGQKILLKKETIKRILAGK